MNLQIVDLSDEPAKVKDFNEAANTADRSSV